MNYWETASVDGIDTRYRGPDEDRKYPTSLGSVLAMVVLATQHPVYHCQWGALIGWRECQVLEALR